MQDVNWGTFDHASHAPKLSLATITCMDTSVDISITEQPKVYGQIAMCIGDHELALW